ncbi:MAG: SBBP repeat-containing protein, partial [Ignavibacteriales bacterium]|nr:SBBP repeat-containing protein [Ignavibacteriales bacterium]
DDSVHGSDIATSIAVDQFGNVYVTGSGIATNGLSDMTTVAYNPIGYQKWVANHDGTGNYSDGGTAIAIDNNNLKIFITGYTNYRLGGYRDATTIRYNDDGTISWLMRYDGTSGGDDIPSALALDRKGNVFVTGSSEGVRSSYDFFTLKYASFETDQWPTRFNNGFGNNWLNDMVTDRWGNVYVCGTDSSHFIVVKYDSTGVKRWSTQFGSKRSNPTDLTVDDFGNVFVTGYTNGPSNNLDYATVKINPMGDIVWSVLYNGTGNLDDMASAIAVSDQGNVYITGSSYGNGSKTDYLTIKYNSQG